MDINNQQMSRKQLIKSVLIAFGIGGIVLITAILPAEYNIDPIGTGKLFGFSRLYVENTPQSNQLNFKKILLKNIGSSPDVIKPKEADNPAPEDQFDIKEDSIEILIAANKGIEYKIKMLKYGNTKYEWQTENGEIVFLDFHGEVEEENPPKDVFYESYTVAYSNNMAGTFTAPFKGKHGWYFKNKTNKEVKVLLKLSGQYQLFK